MQPVTVGNVAQRIAFLGVLLFVLVLPIENVVVLPVVGSLSRLIGVVMAVSAIPAFLARGSFTFRRPSLVVVLLGLFILWTFASLLWSVDTSSTLEYSLTFVQILLFVIILWQVSTHTAAPMAIQQAYVIGCSLAALDGVRNFVLDNEAVYRRFAVSNTDPNDYALALALGIPMAWQLFATSRSWWRVLNLLFIPVALGVIVLSASRGGTIAALVALLVVPLGFGRLDRFGRRAVLALVVASTLVVPVFWNDIATVVGSNIERIGTIGTEITSGTLNEREVLWAAGMEAFSRRPIIGVGGGAFPAAIEKVSGLRSVAHNTFISVAVETGAIGFVLFVAILVVTVTPHLRAFNARSMPSIVLFATLLIGIVPLSWEFRKPTWLVVALLLLVRSVRVGRFAGPADSASLVGGSTDEAAEELGVLT